MDKSSMRDCCSGLSLIVLELNLSLASEFTQRQAFWEAAHRREANVGPQTDRFPFSVWHFSFSIHV